MSTAFKTDYYNCFKLYNEIVLPEIVKPKLWMEFIYIIDQPFSYLKQYYISLHSLSVKEWKFHSLVRVVLVSLLWEWKSICFTLFEWNWNKLHSNSIWKYPSFTLKRVVHHNLYGSLQEWYGGQNDWFFTLLH